MLDSWLSGPCSPASPRARGEVSRLLSAFLAAVALTLPWALQAPLAAAALPQALVSVSELDREQELLLREPQGALKVRLYFAGQVEDSAYFRGISESDDWRSNRDGEILARFRIREGRLELALERLGPDLYVESFFPLTAGFGSDAQSVVSHAAKFYAGSQEGDVTVDHHTYWYGPELQEGSRQEGTPALLSLSPVRAQNEADRISSEYVTAGPLGYSACDGCEHGDQLWVGVGTGRVNTAELPIWGRFYEYDCEGRVHRLLEDLLELGVETRFQGAVGSMTLDYWEGGFWTARSGNVTLGETGVPVAAFLESALARVAEKVAGGKPSERLLKRVEEQGQFVSIDRGLLTFRYQGTELITDLKTGSSILR